MKVDDFKAGDVLMIKTRDGREERVVVYCVNENNTGHVVYSGKESGTGWFIPEEVYDQNIKLKLVYGVRKVGYERPWLFGRRSFTSYSR